MPVMEDPVIPYPLNAAESGTGGSGGGGGLPGPETITTEMLKNLAVTGPKIAAHAVGRAKLENEFSLLTLTGKVKSVGAEPIAIVRTGNIAILRGELKIESAIKAAEEFASIAAAEYRPIVTIAEIPIRSTIGTEKKLTITTTGVLTLSAETAGETYIFDIPVPIF